MAWKRTKNSYSDSQEPDDPDLDMIGLDSLDDAVRSFRDAMKDHGIHHQEVDTTLSRLAIIAVRQGKAGLVSPYLDKLLRRREEEGRLTWHLEDDMAPLLGISVFRLAAAFFEDTAHGLAEVRELSRRFRTSLEQYECAKSLQEILPAVLATRTESIVDPGEAIRRGSGLPEVRSMEASGMCPPAHRQWQVEYFVSRGEMETAINLAHRGRKEDSCGLSCSLAPYKTHALLLAELWERNRQDEAEVLSDRLDYSVNTRAEFLEVNGYRIHYAALTGDFTKAGNLYLRTVGTITQNGLTDWARMKYLEACLKAVSEAKKADRVAEFPKPETEQDRGWIKREWLMLREKFDLRNGIQ